MQIWHYCSVLCGGFEHKKVILNIKEHKVMIKNIFVTGGVLSSVGKGILTSSIGKMLQVR
jgi:CTP synthase